MENLETTKTQEALQIIEMGINKATEKGTYNLTEVYQLIVALNALKTNLTPKK